MSQSRSIPSLDGLRAVAIIAVCLAHSNSAFLDQAWMLPFKNGSLGVIAFFVLSGFLITGILLKEIDKTGGINLKQFYARRAFRIFPAFYFYILVLVGLGLLHLIPFDLPSVLASATYIWNYFLPAKQLTLGQTWSLSLEEQFYILWPVCLFFFSKRTCFRIAVGTILLEPFVRVLTYMLFPVLRTHINMMLHTHIDAILTGSAIALAVNQKIYTGLFANLAKTRWTVLCAIYFLVEPFIKMKFRGAFSLALGMTLDELSWGIVLLHVTRFPQAPLGKVLNWSVVRHIGVISYSIYLWQALFSGEAQRSPFPLNLVWILLCAEGSYWLIEKPFLRLRDRVVGKGVSAPSPATSLVKSAT